MARAIWVLRLAAMHTRLCRQKLSRTTKSALSSRATWEIAPTLGCIFGFC